MSYTLSLTPSDVTVGERTQLVYRFETESPLPLEKISLKENDELIVKANSGGLYSIYSLQFESDGSDCAMIVDFIPWKAGELVFQPFDFSSFVNKTETEELLPENYIIQIPPVLIRSVTQETGINSLQPPSPPLVIPGTTYTVYLSIFVCALLLLLATFVLLRFRQIRELCKKLWIMAKRRRNARKFLRLLRAFVSEKGVFKDNLISAELISKEMRIYLERRFGLEFESAVTGEILAVAEGIFEQCCMENLTQVQKVLARCDELRFSGDEQKKVFENGERSALAAQLKTAVLHFEKYHETTADAGSEEAQNEEQLLAEVSEEADDAAQAETEKVRAHKN